ncbi:MAG: DUF2325 domain-containing protein [Pseudomonadota bacterium]
MTEKRRHNATCCAGGEPKRDWQPPGRRRWCLHEIPGNLQCSILGTCLSHQDLLGFARRLKLAIPAGTSAYDIHSYFVGEAARSGPAARLIQKELDRRFEGQLRRFGRLESEAELAGFWDEAFAGGRVAGAYWALVTSTRVSEQLRKRAFGDVHMLSHALGRTAHASVSRSSELEARVEELEARLQRETSRHQQALAARDGRIRRLEAEAAALRQSPRIALRAAPAIAGRANRAAGLARRRERALISARERARSAEAENARLQSLLRQIQSRRTGTPGAQRPPSSTCPGAEACRLDLSQRRVLYLGGRTRAIERLKSIAADVNAELLHHDGGLEEAVDLIDGLVTRCDAVFCPIDCISHGACERAKHLCRKLAKPFVPLRSSGASSFKRALHELDRFQ